MPRHTKPRAGSLAFWPRKRAKRIYPRLTIYPEADKAKIVGFAAYKAGMTHAILLDNKKGSPTFGEEIAVPVTVLDCPPLKVLGLRTYEETTKGLKVLTELWTKDLPKDLKRKVRIVPKKEEIPEEKISRARLIVSTQPRLAGVGKKRPEVFEIEIGGRDAKEKINFAKNLLGKEINVKDVVREGELMDIIAITKGKGTAGPVKRFGIKIQTRKAAQKRRHVGSIGPQSPGRVRRTTAMAGQLGLQRRTEINKRILKIGEKGEEITPKGGFKRYGIIKGNYLFVEGSVPGPKKRLIMLRPSIRPGKTKLILPEIKEVVK